MAKILIVQSSPMRCEALGPMMLSAVLKEAGHEVRLADYTPSVQHADFLLFSLVAGEEEPRWHQWKASHPGAIFIAGGPLVTYSGKRVTPVWVYELRGPAEVCISQFVKTMPMGIDWSNRPLCTYPDLSKLPWPDRELYPQFTNHRMKRFITARGCDWKCSHCFNSREHHLYKRDERRQRRTVDDVIAEVLHVRKKYGLELAYFNDDDLARDEDWLKEFCERWEREVELPFIGSVRAESITTRKAHWLWKAGCTWMNVALESANTETLKLLNRPANQAKVHSATRNLQRFGIRVRLQNMIGLPVDDPLEDALETLEFNQRVRPADSWCAIYQPLPGTKLHKHCLENHFITRSTRAGSFTSETMLDFGLGNTYQAVKIDRLQRWWHLAVRGQWSREMISAVLELDLGSMHSVFQKLRWKEGAKLLYGEGDLLRRAG